MKLRLIALVSAGLALASQTASAEQQLQCPSADKVASAKDYLEDIERFGKRRDVPNDSACWDVIERDVMSVRERFCSSESDEAAAVAVAHGETCNRLANVTADFEYLHAQEIITKADRAEGLNTEQVTALYDEAGKKLFDIFQQHCEGPTFNNHPPTFQQCEQLGFHAGKIFKQAHETAKAITIMRKVVFFDERLTHLRSAKGQTTSFRAPATREIGNLYRSIFVFDYAADWYEQYAKQFPNEPDADAVLADALFYRLSLGQEEQAVKTAEEFLKLFGKTSLTGSAQVVVALAVHQADAGRLDLARGTLLPTTNLWNNPKVPFDIRLPGTAILARANIRRTSGYQLVLDSTRLGLVDVAGRLKNVWLTDNEEQQAKRYGKLLEAIAEAHFALADDRRIQLVDSLRHPGATGAPLKAWHEARFAAIEKAELEYAAIFGLKPAPPGIWAVRAQAAIAFMWANFYQAHRGDPLGATILTKHAKPALLQCRDLAAKLQVSADEARACERWLGRNFPKEHYGLLEDEMTPGFFQGPLDGMGILQRR